MKDELESILIVEYKALSKFLGGGLRQSSKARIFPLWNQT